MKIIYRKKGFTSTLFPNVRRGRKYLPGTNTLAYFEAMPTRKKKKFVASQPSLLSSPPLRIKKFHFLNQ